MLRRRIPRGIVYDVYIDKAMMPDPVSIVVDGDTVLENVTRDHVRIAFRKPIQNIKAQGTVVQKGPISGPSSFAGPSGGVSSGYLNYSENSGRHCELAASNMYTRDVTMFNPVVSVNPGNSRVIDFTYRVIQDQQRDFRTITWVGETVQGVCVDTSGYFGHYVARGYDGIHSYSVDITIVRYV